MSGALSALLDALTTVRDATSPEATLQSAPRELCAASVFGRVMFSRISGSTWSPEVVYEAGADGRVNLRVDDNAADRIDAMLIPLASPLVEAEVVRRRLPALVSDAQHESRVHQPLVRSTRTTDYVVAPIIAGATVIGLLHADRPANGRPLTAAHRDLLRMFADGVGLSYEKSLLAERLERQRQYVLDVCNAAMGTVAHTPLSRGIALQPNQLQPKQPQPKQLRPEQRELPKARRPQPTENRSSSRLAALTGHEREVLGLLASGATNAQLADRLTVAESTVKSHVKHILHKLGAGNRAAAISYYLRETRGGNGTAR